MIFVKEKRLLVIEKCPQIVVKFSKKLVLKFYFVLLGPLNGPCTRAHRRDMMVLL